MSVAAWIKATDEIVETIVTLPSGHPARVMAMAEVYRMALLLASTEARVPDLSLVRALSGDREAEAGSAERSLCDHWLLRSPDG